MKNYTLHTGFSFGKHKGKTIAEVAQSDPSYLNWCMINLDHFYLENEVLLDLKTQGTDFAFNKEAEAIR